MNATITDKSTFNGRMSWSKQFLPAQYKIIKHFALCRRELVHEIHRNVNIGSDLDADRIICRDG